MIVRLLRCSSVCTKSWRNAFDLSSQAPPHFDSNTTQPNQTSEFRTISMKKLWLQVDVLQHLPSCIAHPRSPAKSVSVGSSRVFFGALLSFALLVAWDHSGGDLWMARWFGSAVGFVFVDHWFWRGTLHDDIRWLPWLIELALLTAVVWPFGSTRQLAMARRVQLALTTLISLLVVSSFKLNSLTSCPWDLQEFGGTLTYVSHWSWGTHDGGSGGCFPAGHASAGFAFIGGFFAFRHTQSQTACRWLAGAMAAGLVLGLAQQVRGAHYMSHTLWTAWLCWFAAALVDSIVSWMTTRTSHKQARKSILLLKGADSNKIASP